MSVRGNLCGIFGRLFAAKTGFGSIKIGFGLAFYEMVLDLSSLVRGRNSSDKFFLDLAAYNYVTPSHHLTLYKSDSTTNKI